MNKNTQNITETATATETAKATRTTKIDRIAQAVTMRDVAAPAQTAADKLEPTAREIVRSNKVTITTEMISADIETWTATFHKTHIIVAKITASDTEYKPTAEMSTATARREGFRKYITENAVKYGVFYDPTDRRTDVNKMPSRYENEDMLMDTAAWLVRNDIEGWCTKIANKLNIKVEIVDIAGESVTPMTEYKGRTVPARYNNGCWAYATVTVVATVNIEDEESYVTLECNLVSGQLSKPKKIGDANYGYSYQGLVSEIARDVAEVANA